VDTECSSRSWLVSPVCPSSTPESTSRTPQWVWPSPSCSSVCSHSTSSACVCSTHGGSRSALSLPPLEECWSLILPALSIRRMIDLLVMCLLWVTTPLPTPPPCLSSRSPLAPSDSQSPNQHSTSSWLSSWVCSVESFVVQSILLLILTLVLIAGRALSRQTSKCLVLAQYSVFLLLAILHLVFDSLSESTPVKTIEFLSYIYLVVYCGALFLFLVDFVCRCFRLAKLVKGVRSSYVDIDAGDRSVNSSTREISKLTIRATSEALNKSFPTTQVEESAQRETKKRSNINVYRDAGLRTIEGSLLNGPNTPSKLIVSPSDSSKMPIPSKNILTLSTTQIINIFDNKQTNGTTTPQPPHPSKL
jgi:hypothetical protein